MPASRSNAGILVIAAVMLAAALAAKLTVMVLETRHGVHCANLNLRPAIACDPRSWANPR
jgi:hypothetical protein